MNYGEYIDVNLTGLKFKPTPFPTTVWDAEFKGTDVQKFKDAVKKIRSTKDTFPTYSEVRAEIHKLIVDEANKRQSELPRLTEEELERTRKCREVFRKGYKWLYSHPKITDEIMVKYYDNIAKEYAKVLSDREGLENVEILFSRADKAQRRIEARTP